MPRQLLFLELNEVNFEFVEAYAARGALPNFAHLIDGHGYTRTVSETRYEHLEPWIQWVTAHTGKSFAEHKVFRLGDIVGQDIPQIWEVLEEHGLKVGAVSPMNAKHRMRDAAFFIPDPWTKTEITASGTLCNLYAALSQAVNDNASARLTSSSIGALISSLALYARPANYAKYLELTLRSLRHSWRRAMVLDLLLADIFIREVQRARPNFATLFLNAAAHIQHHYMFSAEPYNGVHRNPDWYLPRGVDPVRDVYALYDRILGHVRRTFPDARMMLATGLHQVPHDDMTFYWRLKDHAAFLRSIGVSFLRVEPRMSRDFLVVCTTQEAAKTAEAQLLSARASDGTMLFEVDNRGKDLFVMLTYPNEIRAGFRFIVGSKEYGHLYEHVAFVALKNGEHNGIGYFLDTGAARSASSEDFPLKEMPRRIMHALGLASDA